MTVAEAAKAMRMSVSKLRFHIVAGVVPVEIVDGRRDVDESRLPEYSMRIALAVDAARQARFDAASAVNAPTAIEELKALGRDNWEPQHWNLARAIAADSHLGLLSTKTLTRYLDRRQGAADR